MGIESITDEKIRDLLQLSKRVTNPSARNSDKGSHIQKNFQVRSPEGQEFTLYLRQNARIEDDFSCGLLWHLPSGDSLTLVRYNGPSHPHRNRLENDAVDFISHKHIATERYIAAGLKPEGFAQETNAYATLSGAVHALVSDCNISGINTDPDEPDLFK